ncbi:UDP-3-O-(3-hydroxymyristoyl) glucosamine N-acyltransferase [Gluconacetobacter diazotrophicus PA1 5]|uniref:UDP-3-O-(3-hydroxymyristoyl)glucosamine N-acyltransferase n=1 Tax=Gluconacetobacter diazotrophicus TaxID=33996 RepID=UPI000181EFDA|nr:UDP-3-O-(3-hydroxymyristoyl)glucosamine N-acyltransferase [Gluconacetobacter diazotrophicus]ACI50848.1 UDP-3-O-(3-hydroxymyristoyl) glucosamine N-acyltransferase [Gluconacetobacter diazotrophicus PA1 5]
MRTSVDMGNPRFFASSGPHMLSAIAQAVGCALPSRELVLTGLAGLENARPEHVSFLGSRRLVMQLDHTRAGAVLVREEMASHVPDSSIALVVADPFVAWAQVAALFHAKPQVVAGVHPTAVIAADAVVDASAQIGPHVVIGARAEIGARCQLGAGTVIGDGVVLGTDCRIHTHVNISHALLGSRVTLFPGVQVGQEGFGFTMTEHGFLTTPQLGIVEIGNDVEIGANTTIDRGAMSNTVIGDGTRIDNLVQVGHGVRIGRYCAISGHVGLSGSCVLDDYVTIGGQAGLADHVHVGAKAQIGAKAGVMSDIAAGMAVLGAPAQPVKEFFREVAMLRRLTRRNGKVV